MLHSFLMQPHHGDTQSAPLRATPLGDARAIARSIAGLLRVARALAASDRRIDLAGLQEPVGLLCAKSLDLPPDEGRRMRIVLIALRQELDDLSATLRAPRGGAGTPS